MTNNLSIAQIIKDLIRANQYSNSKLATELKVSRSLVGKWTSGKNRPNPVAIKEMAKIFGVEPAYIADYEETPPVNPTQLSSALAAAKAARNQLDRVICALESIDYTGLELEESGPVKVSRFSIESASNDESQESSGS